uniref:Uncharacterized protein n=1 Tax=Romanomermis culicivorax TaxID=13658 RepID=A0A915HRA6_ROMCU
MKIESQECMLGSSFERCALESYGFVQSTKLAGYNVLVASIDDKLKQRALRFSLNETKTKVTLTPIKPKSSEEVRKASDALSKRKQRFGDMLIDQNTGPEAKKQMRAQRFGTSEV